MWVLFDMFFIIHIQNKMLALFFVYDNYMHLHNFVSVTVV
jgi:hypothetical protein